MPVFEKINSENIDNLKIVLISLDFRKQINNRLIPFIKENNIKSEVILLSDNDADYWINDINKNWTGAIPATIINNKGKITFIEGQITYNQLINHIK